MDIFIPEKRSLIMSKVGHTNTKPELIVRSVLHKMGFRFRLHSNRLPGHPDIVLPKWKTVIFVHGCFWHRHEQCKSGNSVPKSNTTFWISKFERNVARDRRIINELEGMGWRVMIIWECQTRKKEELKRLLFEELILEREDVEY